MNPQNFKEIFLQAIMDYHKQDLVEAPCVNPFATKDLRHLLYLKCWIDTVQWHQEDEIRNPDIDPKKGMQLKRSIDRNNQRRTDRVEQLDDLLLENLNPPTPRPDSILNTESIGWAVDRLSILCLKIYHMKEETLRQGVAEDHTTRCRLKLQVLETQQTDLIAAIQSLIESVQSGRVVVKVYRQMKMYNDRELNPILYKST